MSWSAGFALVRVRTNARPHIEIYAWPTIVHTKEGVNPAATPLSPGTMPRSSAKPWRSSGPESRSEAPSPASGPWPRGQEPTVSPSAFASVPRHGPTTSTPGYSDDLAEEGQAVSTRPWTRATSMAPAPPWGFLIVGFTLIGDAELLQRRVKLTLQPRRARRGKRDGLAAAA